MSRILYSSGPVQEAVVDCLLHDEELLRERVRELEGDVVAYRQLLKEALDQLHVLTMKERRRQAVSREQQAQARRAQIRRVT